MFSFPAAPVSLSKITSSNGPPWWAGNQGKAAGSLHGWTSCSWLSSAIKGMHTRHRSRDRWPRRKTEALAKLAGIGLGMPKPTKNWIWAGLWRAMRNASTRTSAGKGGPGKMWADCWIWPGSQWQRIQEKPAVLNALFASVLTGKISLQESHIPETHFLGKYEAGKRNPWWKSIRLGSI